MSTLSAQWRTPDRPRQVLLLCLVLCACLLVLNRHQLLSHFTVLAGDRFDVVISTTILEHWFKVFTGQAQWTEVGYFYPYTRTIAQTDAYFLLGLAYTPFRLMGLDPFMAAELGNMLIKSIGVFGTYLLCRRVFAIPVYWALLAAAMFTLSNGVTAHASRIQLTTVTLAPVVALLIWHAFHAVHHNHPARFLRNGVAAGVLFGAWCLSCFYMAWFFAFFTTVLLVVVAVRTGADTLRRFGRHLAGMPAQLAAVLVATALAMLPFVWAFLPKSKEVGVRAFASVAGNTVPIEGILQVGRKNLLFGELYNKVLAVIAPAYKPVGEYYDTGFSIVLFGVFIVGCVYLLGKARKAGRDQLLVSIALATLITWLLSLNVGGHTGWYLVYTFFPGAKALNVVAAYQMMLALPVILIAVSYLAQRRLAPLVAVVVAAVLLAGELNTPYLNMNRPRELARLGQPPQPPQACKSFYTSGWSGEAGFDGFPEVIYGAYAHNVSAMLVAQMVNLPTLNGTASFTPPDWNFGNPWMADYDTRMIAYALNHQVGGLCKYDLNSRKWQVLNRFMQVEGGAGGYTSTIDFSKAVWNGVLATGLSFAEPWGTWSAAKNVTFEFAASLPDQVDVHLTGHALGPNVDQPVAVTIGGQTRSVQFGAADSEQIARFSGVGSARSIAITVPQPTSPKSLGWGTDERMLGLGFKELRLVPR